VPKAFIDVALTASRGARPGRGRGQEADVRLSGFCTDIADRWEKKKNPKKKKNEKKKKKTKKKKKRPHLKGDITPAGAARYLMGVGKPDLYCGCPPQLPRALI